MHCLASIVHDAQHLLQHRKAACSRAAKWRGCTVAVKVLSHEGSQSARVNALHESVVSQHVSHPNVVGSACASASTPVAQCWVMTVLISGTRRQLTALEFMVSALRVDHLVGDWSG